jgi:hypothetical protein
MTKKELVEEIRGLLEKKGIKKDGCFIINTIPDIGWVSYDEVLKREHVKGVTYRNYRPKLYSKDVSLNDLCAIRHELAKED